MVNLVRELQLVVPLTIFSLVNANITTPEIIIAAVRSKSGEKVS
jgi:hypothetical protein